jgi:hypothetical protein
MKYYLIISVCLLSGCSSWSDRMAKSLDLPGPRQGELTSSGNEQVPRSVIGSKPDPFNLGNAPQNPSPQ